MLILTGSSASGKTELAHELIRSFGFHRLVTCTTRAMRAGEEDGRDYHFFSEEEFSLHEKNGDFVETASYAGKHYGSLKTGLTIDTVAVLEPQGVNAYLALYPEDVCVMLLSASRTTRQARMRLRGDLEEDIVRRLARDDEHFAPDAIARIDRVLENENITIPCLAREAATTYQAFMSRKK